MEHQSKHFSRIFFDGICPLSDMIEEQGILVH